VGVQNVTTLLIPMTSKKTSKALYRLTAIELIALLRTNECSAREVTESCIARIAELDPVVRAFVDIDVDGALRRAIELDEKSPSGPLHGVPIAVKETVDVAGLKCTLGTQVHRSRIPACDAIAVQRLREAGAIIVGTTVSTEYAIARAGPTTNPHNSAHTPGGSSSGSAAAVAAGMVPIAVGTQTIGSIIRPSTYCGIFGLKPTKGAINTSGAMPLSVYLDHIGPMARTVADISLACRIMFDRDAAHSAIISSDKTPTRALRIEGPMQERIESPTREALNRAQTLLEGNGIQVERGSLPSTFANVVSCYETILFRDIALNHGQDRDAFGNAMSDRLRKIIDDGRAVSDREYNESIAEAEVYRQKLRKLLAGDTIILAPATDGAAPIFSEETGPSRLQGLWTLAGLPALAVPCGKVEGLPVGVQLIAAPERDNLVLSAGGLFTAEWPPEPSHFPRGCRKK
jgi:Asp-tRNA(Asn)/Glu-tRNA(Gln) amidotransferase A subunit family amidase